MSVIDKQLEAGSRRLAMLTSRRGLLSQVGKWVLGAAVMAPLLPIERTFAQAPKQDKEPTDADCEYWKYCAMDGLMCACCGGSSSQCPPGTTVSKVSWVGTCHNHKDGKNYLISYSDCCGKSSCGQCYCSRNERERPGYQMGVHNDSNWCMANANAAYHCTLTVVVGEA